MDLTAALLGYLLLTSIAIAMAVLPEVRQGVHAWMRSRLLHWWSRVERVRAGMGSGVARVGVWTASARARLGRWGRREWAWTAAATSVLLLPPLIAYWAGAGRMLGSYDDWSVRPVDAQIAALLEGEHLVPPPPLPPEVFATREVQEQRPMLSSASREWSLLDADFRQRLLLVFKIMREQHGYELALLEGYRSPERQDMLRQKGGHVTHAGAFQSYHQFGLAADCAFLRDGKLVISEKDPWAARGYQLYGEVAESVGLTWGGRWKSIVDLGHVELRRPGVLRKADEG
ncbi:MAG TPA: M15 family metallopeptidase [Burkholderiaceae bacterium]|nr:M15 family metallopeptidase [Burkholderiaceae bacterium]